MTSPAVSGCVGTRDHTDPETVWRKRCVNFRGNLKKKNIEIIIGHRKLPTCRFTFTITARGRCLSANKQADYFPRSSFSQDPSGKLQSYFLNRRLTANCVLWSHRPGEMQPGGGDFTWARTRSYCRTRFSFEFLTCTSYCQVVFLILSVTFGCSL